MNKQAKSPANPPDMDDVLRRMLATPPTPHEKTLVKARKKKARKTRSEK